MPNIIFKGITKANDPIFNELNQRPAGAVTFNIPSNNMTVSMVYAIPFLLLCFAALIIKKNTMSDLPMVLSLIPLGILFGILCCFIHELLHALLQPNGATVYIGLIPARLIFYMKCKEPISKSRFIVMSLLPVVLGIAPLAVFMLSTSAELNSIMWPMALIGFTSPSPDYLNVRHIINEVPKGAFIQDDENGLCWFLRESATK